MSFKHEAPIPAVAKIILSLLELDEAAEVNSPTKDWCKAVLPFALRQMECFVKPEVSDAAHAAALASGCPNLQSKWYGFQEVDSEKRPLFHWEHVLPVSDLAARLRALPSPRSVESVEALLRKTDIAWILKTEDNSLDMQKFRTRRPENPWNAYITCGIRVVGKPWLRTQNENDCGTQRLIDER